MNLTIDLERPKNGNLRLVDRELVAVEDIVGVDHCRAQLQHSSSLDGRLEICRTAVGHHHGVGRCPAGSARLLNI